MGFIANYIANLTPVALGLEPKRPLLFSYYATHRCNLGCAYCSDGHGIRFKEDPIPELGTKDAKRLITLLSRCCDTLDITGGEPLLRNDLETLLEHARSAGMRTILNTKGPGLRERPELLRCSNVLVLGIDALEESKLAQRIGRPIDAAKEILSSLDYALSKRRETGTKLALSVVASPGCLDSAEQMLDFAMANKLGFHLSPEIRGTSVHPALRNNADYRRIIDKALSAKKRGACVLGVPEYLEGIRDFRPFHCHPLLMPTIRPDGRLYYPCLEYKKAEISVLEAGSYPEALRQAKERQGRIPDCGDRCHIFCHMALSLLQRHPISALGESRHWEETGKC
ncbi:MAG: radical SAM protein [Elusimicrobiota bacterium]|jgi:pyruvate-formate lyase-activating enzyme